MSSNFDIAIIGMSCRFPGADNLDAFWKNLENGVESITHFSDEELRESGIPDSLINNPNYVKAAPVISEPGMFDAGFFGFTPMEAKNMDPQHRILLECAHEALENSGYDPEKSNGRVGVFTGSAMNTYFMNNILHSKFIDEYIPTLIANDKDFLSTRISYKLNLKGPSINVQTACSTSSVAVHLACQSLISEESDMALAGAVSVKAPHKAGYICDGGGIVSKDAHVRAFDAKANGTVFGSGCGIIVLKRLSDAIADGDTIHAVIKGSAINNDGSEKAGYTAPSVNSQADAAVEALSLADVGAETITYIEAHGSGTPLGDPIELTALTKAFRNYTDHRRFCAVGSVKTNVGHLDAAAGMAGLIKTVLSLKNKKIPPSINYSEPNPEIDFINSPFFVNAELKDWKSTGPRRAGIMSTGMGGTNAYLVLEEAPGVGTTSSSDLPNLLLLSAKSETALNEYSMKLSEFLKNNSEVNINDVAYTLQQGRKALNHRRFLVSKDRSDAIEILEQEKSKRVFSGKLKHTSKRPVIFLFPGIGDHYVGMGYDLYHNIKIFREEVDRCANILKEYLDVDIRDVLYPKDYNRSKPENGGGIDLKKMLASRVNKSADENTLRLNQTLYAQPALFTLEYALSKLWIHLGVVPDAIVGHSMGEYVAASLSGVFTLEDALKLIAIRAKLVNSLPQGGMLAVTLPEKELLPLLNDSLSISLINSPNLCVVAGSQDSIKQFEETLSSKKILYRQVQNAHAFHSKMLDPIYDDFVKEVKKIKLSSPKIKYTSNLTGKWITDDEATSPDYWAKHATSTARFSDALEKGWQINNSIFLEAGPGNTLSVLAMQHPESRKNEDPVTLSSLRAEYDNQSDINYLLNSIGKLWLAGVEIDWDKLYENEKPKRIPIPTYPFQKENYWIEEKPTKVAEQVSQKSATKNERNEFKDWFYIPSWKRSFSFDTRDRDFNNFKNTNWLIFSSDSIFEKEVIKKLIELSCNIYIVKKGTSFVSKDERTIEINHQIENDYVSLFQELTNRNFHPSNILNFWNYDSPSELTTSNQKLEESLYNTIYSLFFLAKSLQKNNITQHIKLGLITKNLHSVLGNEKLVSPETSMILGSSRVINKEIENIFCKCIDFSEVENGSNDLSSQLLNELIRNDDQEIIAYRGKYRWLQSFEKIDLVSDRNLDNLRTDKIKTGGVYLIIGGTGGLGLVFAEHFAKSENVKLILTKKLQFPEKSQWQAWIKQKGNDDKTSKKISQLLEIEKWGSKVDIEICDISTESETKSLLEKINKNYGRIDGVIHAAGTYGDQIIYQKNIESIRNIIVPKVVGAVNIINNIEIKGLDFFVLFSSISSFISPTGQFDYSAANIYMDYLAGYLNSQNYSNIISLNWYAWKEVGILPNMVVSSGMKLWKEKLLEVAILNEEGIKSFNFTLNKNYHQVIISPQNPSELIHDEFEKHRIYHQSHSGETKSSVYLEEMITSDNGIENTLIKIVKDILGIKKLDKSDNFFELGGHSLLAIQLISAIRNSFHIDLGLEDIFNATTLSEIADKINENSLLKEA